MTPFASSDLDCCKLMITNSLKDLLRILARDAVLEILMHMFSILFEDGNADAFS